MRILHVYKDYPPVRGGIEHHIQILAEEQERRGHDVSVLVSASGGRSGVTIEQGVRIVRARSPLRLRSTPLSPALPLWMRRLPADVTHLHFPFPPGEVAELVAGRARAVVLSYHSDIVRQRVIGGLYRPLLRLVLRRAGRVIVSSPGYAATSSVLARLGRTLDVVPYGIRPEDAARVDPEVRGRLQRRWPGRRILFVGRLRYYKGLRHLIDAMQTVPADLLVVGEGPLRRALEQQAEGGAAAERIHFVGDVEPAHLAAYYSAADALVLPSDSRAEAFGIVQLEAMAVGTPVVSTEVGTGTSWVNRHGETGLVVPAADPPALAAALSRLLASSQMRRRMGEQGRRRVTDHFTAARMTDNILEVYRQALTSR